MIRISYFIIIIHLVQVYSVSNDQACTDINGHCQDDHNKCSGSYYTGKCAGGVTRRCCTKTPEERDAGYCSSVEIISRDSWGARRPDSISYLQNPVPYFSIHHTAGDSCHSFTECVQTMKGLQNYFLDIKQYADIAYSFLVGQDGKIYEGRGFQREGAHTRGYNSVGLAASFMGNYMDHLPSSKSQEAVKALIKCGLDNGYISSTYKLYGHRDVGTTACPGNALYPVIQTWPHYSFEKPNSG